MTNAKKDIKTRLQSEELHGIEADVTRKRLSWFEARHHQKKSERPTPRDAYGLFLLDYLGLSEDQVPVVHETDTEITWLSKNRCPTLDACRELGLDTRTVCRGAYEKSTQMLLSRLDPQLRFVRDYEEIRPHVPHCKESIVRVNFEALMQTAGTGAIVACKC